MFVLIRILWAFVTHLVINIHVNVNVSSGKSTNAANAKGIRLVEQISRHFGYYSEYKTLLNANYIERQMQSYTYTYFPMGLTFKVI